MNRKVLAGSIAAALMAPGAAWAIDYKISGHVNRMIRWADDGKGSDVQHLDNEGSRTRFRFRGTGNVGNGATAHIYIETSVASNDSQNVPLKTADGGDIAFDIRHSRLGFTSRFGTVYLGHTSTALDSTAQADLSGNTESDWAESAPDLVGAVAWRTSTGGTVGGGATVTSSRSSFDGGRRDVLRYDSPSLGPLTVVASVGNQSLFGAAGHIDSEIGGGTLNLSGGWEKQSQVNGYDQWAASGSFRFSQGTSITGQIGGREFDASSGRTDSAFTYYGKLGHSFGNSTLSVSGGQTQDLLTNGADSWDVGVGFIHTIPRPGVDIYAGYRHLELDTDQKAKTALGISGQSTEDINTFVFGAKVKFD